MTASRNIGIRTALGTGFAVLIVVALGACALPSPQAPAVVSAPAPLREGRYRASWLSDGLNPAPTYSPMATADFAHREFPVEPGNLFSEADFTVGFSAYCNIIEAAISGFDIINYFTTEMGCPEDSFEPTLLENLDRKEFRILNDSQFVVGDLLFTWWLAPGETVPLDPNTVLRDGIYEGGLEETDGTVVSYRTIAKATVSEGGTQFVFDAGCNVLRTGVVDGVVAPIVSTRMACPPDSLEDVFLAHADTDDFELLGEGRFRVGDITFGWIGDSADPEIAQRFDSLFNTLPEITFDLNWDTPVPPGDSFGVLNGPGADAFGSPLYGYGEISGERVLVINLWGSSSCPPVIERASISSGSLTVRLDGEAYPPDRPCTADLVRHIFILTPTAAAIAAGNTLSDDISAAIVDMGASRTADGGVATGPGIPIERAVN